MRSARAARLVAVLAFAAFAGALGLIFALASPAAADNCSSPGDCEQTGGYNGVIAVVGGIAAVAAAAAAVAARTPDGADADVGIVQVSDDRIDVTVSQDGEVTLTGWHAGSGGTYEQVDMPLRIEVPPGCGLVAEPTDGVGELVVRVSLTESSEEKEVTITASGDWQGQTATAEITVVVKYDVVVVGGGLAGLTTALRLDQAGRSVVVLEMNDYLGGRMLSQRLATYPGVCVDVGGQWVGPSQDAILRMAADLQISRYDSYHTGRTVFVWKGQRSTFEGDFPPFSGDPPPVPPADLADAIRVWQQIESLAVGPEPWKSPLAPSWDALRLSDWLATTSTGDFAKFVVTLLARIGGSGAFEPREVSLLHMLFTQSIAGQREEPEKWLLHGCAGQIPGKLDALLQQSPKVKLLRNAPVSSIEEDDEKPERGVTVSSGVGAFRASKVVVAMPPWHAGRINYTPSMPPGRVGLTTSSPMGKLMKIHVVYKRAFWRDRGLNGVGVGDLQTVQFTADSSAAIEPGILTCFIAGDRAEELSAVDPGTRRNLVIADYVTYFGPEAANYLEYVEKNWIVHPGVEGAFTTFMPPGAWTRYGASLREPVGHVHWAGTETAERWSGYFSGAVLSGERAASEIDALLPKSRP